MLRAETGRKGVPLDGTVDASRARGGNGTTAADRVADVLLAVGIHDGAIGVSTLARRLELSKAVVYRILQSLTDRQLLRFDPAARAYELGPSAMILGARALRTLDLRTAALPVLRQLQQLTGETTTVSALVGSMRIYLDQVPSHRELKMMVETGRPYPLHAGSSSKAILAFAPRALREQVLDEELASLTPQTITDRETLEAELERIRCSGVAVSRGERQHGAGSVAAPLFGPHGDVIGSISICGPIHRFEASTLRRYSPIVRRCAEEISKGLVSGRGQAEAAASG
jgi:IclR family acetate operon transcriptional repressor